MNVIHLAAATAIAFTSCFGGVQTALAETLKVSTFVPPKHAFNRMLKAWGEELSEKSGGELKVEIFPAGQLGPPPRQFDLVRAGGADVSVVLHGATPGRFPLSELAGLPLTTPSEGAASAVTSRRLTELVPDGHHLVGNLVSPLSRSLRGRMHGILHEPIADIPLLLLARGKDTSGIEKFHSGRGLGIAFQTLIDFLNLFPSWGLRQTAAIGGIVAG